MACHSVRSVRYPSFIHWSDCRKKNARLPCMLVPPSQVVEAVGLDSKLCFVFRYPFSADGLMRSTLRDIRAFSYYSLIHDSTTKTNTPHRHSLCLAEGAFTREQNQRIQNPNMLKFAILAQVIYQSPFGAVIGHARMLS